MNNQRGNLLSQFIRASMTVTLVSLLLCGIGIYLNQTNLYEKQRVARLQNMADYLAATAQDDGENFVAVERYLRENRKIMLLPLDRVGNYKTAQADFERLFSTRYPGLTLGQNIAFNNLSEDVKAAYAGYFLASRTYKAVLAAEKLGVSRVSFLAPDGDPPQMMRLYTNSVAEKNIDGSRYLDYGAAVAETGDEREQMWEIWRSVEKVSGYDKLDGGSGKTYVCYAPVVIGGQKIGLMEAELAVDNFLDRNLLRATFMQTAVVGVTLMICLCLLLLVINRYYISRVDKLSDSVRDFVRTQDPYIAERIQKYAKGDDEVSMLARQIASLIRDLDNHVNNLWSAAAELSKTKERAAAMDKLAMLDALTGLRNKAAYDHEIKRLEKECKAGKTKFGMAMIDLNFLKRTNDTYGHDKGNISIKKLSDLVCQIFAHSPVFRIGGDEFVIILENSDYDNLDNLVGIFRKSVDRYSRDESQPPWERISASLGYAVYDPEIDATVENVFKRADKEMYLNKTAMKAVRKD